MFNLQIMSNSDESNDARIAAVHALRRIVLHYIEHEWFHKQPSSSDSSSAKKASIYNKWFQSQFSSIKDGLIQLLSEDEAFHAVAVRTYTELMKVDTFIEEGPTSSPRLHMESFKALMYALVISKNEIDVDLLLMIKDEVRNQTVTIRLVSLLVLPLLFRSFLCTIAPTTLCSW